MTLALFAMVSKGFVASEDSGIIYGFIKVPVGLPIAEFSTRQQALTNVIIKNPNVESVMSSIGQGKGGGKASNNAENILFV